MTAVDSAPAPRRRGRTVEWIGHHSRVLYLVALPVSFATDLLPSGNLLSWAALVPLVALILLGFRHNKRLCEPCIASMPLDGSGAAARRRRTLRLVHWVGDDPSSGRFRGVRIPGNRLLPFVIPMAAFNFVVPTTGPLAMAGHLLGTAPLMWFLYCDHVHFRLQPWCPQCHWGNGRDGIPEPSPDPSIDSPVPV